MNQDIDDLLSEFDDLREDVSRSKHEFFGSNLRRWFAFLDDTPEIANTIRRLEGSIDFEQWRKDGLQPQCGMGHGRIVLPEGRDKRLGALIGMFRSLTMSENAGLQFAHSYVSSKRNINENIADLVDQLFDPFARDLRRQISRDLTDETTPEPAPIVVPASDRIVEIDHNKPAHKETETALERLREAVRGENAFDNPDEKERCIAEIETIPVLIRPKNVRLLLLASAVGVLTYLVAKFADAVVGRLAENALKKLLELIPALAPFFG